MKRRRHEKTASRMIPLLYASRSPRRRNWWGAYSSRARKKKRRGKSEKDVLAASRSTAVVATPTKMKRPSPSPVALGNTACPLTHCSGDVKAWAACWRITDW
jgi:hypothetical protein